MKLQRSYLADFVSLLFPQLCQCCGESLGAQEDLVCTDCLYNLPYTNFHLSNNHIVAQQFWGKINIEAAYAMLYFTKGGNIQHLMHQFKYKGQRKIGNLLGRLAGGQLLLNPSFSDVDIIIPVPLHKNRLRDRGYNQSKCFADGIAEKMRALVMDDNLVRIKATETQTKKSRIMRFENMKNVFELRNPALLVDKHVLLVDDIVTTGSTLEACGSILLSVSGLRLSIATIAYAE